jgi:hypothetical protein
LTHSAKPLTGLTTASLHTACAADLSAAGTLAGSLAETRALTAPVSVSSPIESTPTEVFIGSSLESEPRVGKLLCQDWHRGPAAIFGAPLYTVARSTGDVQ